MIPDRLLSSPRTDAVHLSTTSRCNLRCVYCDVSKPGYSGSDFDFTRFDEVIALLKQRGVKGVSFYGEGETTFVPGWDRHLAKLQQAGIQTALVTNLARRLEPREIEVLLSVDDLYISCDTTDAEVFKRTRSGNVSILIHNMLDMQARAIQAFGRTKDVTWHCVLNSMSYKTLVAWVASGLILGVARFSVAQILPKDHNQQVFCITTLPDAELDEALRIIGRARDLAEKGGRVFALQAGFAQVLAQRSPAAAAATRSCA